MYNTWPKGQNGREVPWTDVLFYLDAVRIPNIHQTHFITCYTKKLAPSFPHVKMKLTLALVLMSLIAGKVLSRLSVSKLDNFQRKKS